MRFLVTGCAGFIGWRLSEKLLEEGHEVIGIDNLNRYYDVRLKMWRLSRLQHKNFKFIKGDIRNLKLIEELSRENFDAVFNLAARAGVRASVENPRAYVETNIKGTLNLLEMCKRIRCKLIFASSSSVYGAEDVPFSETSDTSKSLSPYAATKKGAELLCYSYHHIWGTDVVALRYFTVYGPACRPDMSIFRFMKWIYEGKPVVVFGDGSQKRDFTYVDDIVDGTLKARNCSGYDVFNLGSDSPVQIIKAIKIIEREIGRRAEIIFKPVHPADIPATWADIEKAREILGWEPEVDIEEGIKRTVNWFIENSDWVLKIKIFDSWKK